MKSIRKRLTYANVMSSIAVFLVVAGGTAFAAVELGKESVGTKQLAKEAVSLAKIKKSTKNALKGQTGPAGPAGAKGSVGPEGAKGATGDKGTTGSTGTKGDTGEKGERGPSAGFSVNADNILEFTASPQTVATLTLPAGKYILTGYSDINNNSSGQVGANCKILVNGLPVGETDTVNLAENGKLDRQVLTVSAGGSLAATSTAELSCTVATTEGNYLGRGLTAVQVGSLNGA